MKTYSCPQCSRTFKNGAGFGAHRRWHKKSDPMPEMVGEIIKPTGVLETIREVRFLAGGVGGLAQLRLIVEELMDSA